MEENYIYLDQFWHLKKNVDKKLITVALNTEFSFLPYIANSRYLNLTRQEEQVLHIQANVGYHQIRGYYMAKEKCHTNTGLTLSLGGKDRLLPPGCEAEELSAPEDAGFSSGMVACFCGCC